MTILLTWPAPNRSPVPGGDDAVAAVGDLLRCVLEIPEVLTDDERLIAPRIFMASALEVRSSGSWFSASELPVALYSSSRSADLEEISDLRFAEFDLISLNGLCSVSEEDSTVNCGATTKVELLGEPSDFLDRKPALNRSFLEGMVSEASGAGRIGDDCGDPASSIL